MGFEQLLHRHGLVDVILGSRDLLTGDQEPQYTPPPDPSDRCDEQAKLIPPLHAPQAGHPDELADQLSRQHAHLGRLEPDGWDAS